MIPKSAFKAHALEILQRVETTGQSVIITNRGRPVARIAPYYGNDDALLAALQGSVIAYHEPTEPIEADA